MPPALEASLALLLAVPLYVNILLLRGRAGPDPQNEDAARSPAAKVGRAATRPDSRPTARSPG